MQKAPEFFVIYHVPPERPAKKCRESGQLPIIDKVRPVDKLMLFLDG
jgi:hypothetical protein